MPHADASAPHLPRILHDIAISVVAPAHNEQENIEELVDQVGAALARTGLSHEFVIVDDGSTDRTRARIEELMATRPWLRCIAMQRTPPGKGNGQSAAFHAGFRAARGAHIATLDADLQNDPGDLPAMLEHMRAAGADMVQGDRSHARRDSLVRRAGSVVGRKVRLWLLGDSIRDTGCSLRVMRREIALGLPLEFKGMHRFIPVTARHLGFKVVEMRVNHRPRTAGETKYGRGITKRAIPGLIDLLAVRYMRGRRRPVGSVEMPSRAVDVGSPTHPGEALSSPAQPVTVARPPATSGAGA
ncbi:MAG: glycosyltransferase family 2 protein [Phycisphaerales bacterium]|nr:glycosyltransferase family 2 protein [Phycisphaerales bacterium]